jgi:hypothetical protein
MVICALCDKEFGTEEEFVEHAEANHLMTVSKTILQKEVSNESILDKPDSQ